LEKTIRPTICGPVFGYDGLAKLQGFVQNGGVLLTVDDTAQFALSVGMGAGVNAARSEKMKIVVRWWERSWWMVRARLRMDMTRRFRRTATMA